MGERSVQVIGRVIALKQQTLEALRADLNRLETMVERAMRIAEQHDDAVERFTQEMRAQERSGIAMNVEQMMGRRAYAAHLEAQAANYQQQLRAVTDHRDEARQAFEAVVAEVRVLERVAERKSREIAHEQRRRDYAVADDTEMLRHERARRLADADV